MRAFLAARRSAESDAQEPDAAESQVLSCKFCGSQEHCAEKCAEADKCILAGKYMSNVFGKIVLPSGAENSPTTHERQNPPVAI